MQEYNVLVFYKIIKQLLDKLCQIERMHHLYPYLWEVFEFFNGKRTDYEIRKIDEWLNIIQ